MALLVPSWVVSWLAGSVLQLTILRTWHHWYFSVQYCRLHLCPSCGLSLRLPPEKNKRESEVKFSRMSLWDWVGRIFCIVLAPERTGCTLRGQYSCTGVLLERRQLCQVHALRFAKPIGFKQAVQEAIREKWLGLRVHEWVLILLMKKFPTLLPASMLRKRCALLLIYTLVKSERREYGFVKHYPSKDFHTSARRAMDVQIWNGGQYQSLSCERQLSCWIHPARPWRQQVLGGHQWYNIHICRNICLVGG